MPQKVLPQRLVQPAHQPQVFLLQTSRRSGFWRFRFCAVVESYFFSNNCSDLSSNLRQCSDQRVKVQTQKTKSRLKLNCHPLARHRFYPNPSRVEKWRCDYNFKTMHKSSDFIFINCTSFRNILVKLFSISNRQCLVYMICLEMKLSPLSLYSYIL